MAQKAFNRSPLYRGQITESVLQLTVIGNIGEKLPRIDKILVHVIEIPQNHIAPEDEFIQRLSLGINAPVTFIQFQQQTHPVRRLHSSHTEEQIIDCNHLRSNHWLAVRRSCNRITKIFPEEYHRATVRKDKASPAYVSHLIEMVCNLFQERYHMIFFSFSPLPRQTYGPSAYAPAQYRSINNKDSQIYHIYGQIASKPATTCNTRIFMPILMQEYLQITVFSLTLQTDLKLNNSNLDIINF